MLQDQIGYEFHRVDYALVHTVELGWMADIVKETTISIAPDDHRPVIAEGIDAKLIGDAIAVGVQGQGISGGQEVIPGPAVFRIIDAGGIKEVFVVVDDQGGMVDRQAMQFAVDLIICQDCWVVHGKINAIALDEFIDRQQRAFAGVGIGDMGCGIEDIGRCPTGDGGLQLGVIVAAAADILEFDIDAGLFGESFGDRHGDVFDAVLVPAHEPLDGGRFLRGRAQAKRQQKDNENCSESGLRSSHHLSCSCSN